jgi:hypothetical protein
MSQRPWWAADDDDYDCSADVNFGVGGGQLTMMMARKVLLLNEKFTKRHTERKMQLKTL